MGIGPKHARREFRHPGTPDATFHKDPRAPFADPGAPWLPPTDVAIVGDTFVIRMEIAGVSLDDLTVFQDGRTLIVEGERQRPPHEDGATYDMMEIQTGPFGRSFQFPDYIRLDNIRARYVDGILEIRLHKSSEPPRAPVSIRLTCTE